MPHPRKVHWETTMTLDVDGVTTVYQIPMICSIGGPRHRSVPTRTSPAVGQVTCKHCLAKIQAHDKQVVAQGRGA
jgi:hypothetical protein